LMAALVADTLVYTTPIYGSVIAGVREASKMCI